ncbi:MAG: hypothetical protein ACAI38_18135 [Myxococcota bacterium]
MSTRRPTRGDDSDPIARFFRSFTEPAPVARPARRSNADRSRERARQAERERNRDLRVDPRAQPTARRATTERATGPGRPVRQSGPTPPVRRATTPDPAAARPQAARFDARLPIAGANLMPHLRGTADVSGVLRSSPDPRVSLAGNQPARLGGTVGIDSRTGITGTVRISGLSAAGGLVPIEGVRLVNNRPVSANLGWVSSLIGDYDIRGAQTGNGTVNATVNISNFLGPGIQLQPAPGARPPSLTVTPGERGSARFTLSADVASAVLGAPQDGVRMGRGRIQIEGTRAANGQVTMTVREMDVQNARIAVPVGRGQVDTVGARRLVLPRGSSIEINNGRLARASLANAQVTGLSTDLSVVNGAGERARLRVSDSDANAGVRNINLDVRPFRDGEPRERGDRTRVRFEADTNGLDLRLATGDGFTMQVRDGLHATLRDGTRLSGSGRITYEGAIRNDGTPRVGRWALASTGDDPLTLTTNAQVHGVNQLVGSAVANMHVNAGGTLQVRAFASDGDFSYTLRATATGTPRPGRPDDAHLSMRQVTPIDPRTGQPRQGYSFEARHPNLDVNLTFNRTGTETTVDGHVRGAIAEGTLGMPLTSDENNPGALNVAIRRDPRLPASGRPQTVVSIPVRGALKQDGTLSTPEAPPLYENVQDYTAMLAGCRAALAPNGSLDAVTQGRWAAMCSRGVVFSASHEDSGDLTPIAGVDRGLRNQPQILREAAERAAENPDQARELAERNARLDTALRGAGVDLNATPRSLDETLRQINLGQVIGSAQDARFDVRVPLGPDAQDLDITPAGQRVGGARLVIPANTTLNVTTLRRGDEPAHGVELSFSNPITVNSSAFMGAMSGSTTFHGIRFVPGTDGRLRAEPFERFTDASGQSRERPVVNNSWSPLNIDIWPTVQSQLAPLLGPAVPSGPARANVVPQVLANIVSMSGMQLDADTNPASRVDMALGNTPVAALIRRAMHAAEIRDAQVTIPSGTRVPFGSNLVTLASGMRLTIDKPANSGRVSLVGENPAGGDLALGPTSIATDDRRFQLSSGSARRFTVNTTIGDDRVVTQDFNFEGFRARDLRIGQQGPWHPRQATSFVLGPSEVSGDVRLTTVQQPNHRLAMFSEMARRMSGGERQDVLAPGVTTTTFAGNLRVSGPLTVRNLELTPAPGAGQGRGEARIQELTFLARGTDIAFGDDQVSVVANGEEPNLARIRYSGRIVSPKPTDVEMQIPEGSLATADIRRLSFYVGNDEAREHLELQIRNLRSITEPGPTTRERMIRGSVRLGPSRLDFEAPQGEFVAPILHVVNSRRAPQDNRTHVIFSGIDLPNTVMAARVADEGGHGNVVIRGRMRYSFGIFADRTRSVAAGDLQVEDAEIAAVAGGTLRMSQHDLERRMQQFRDFIRENGTPR